MQSGRARVAVMQCQTKIALAKIAQSVMLDCLYLVYKINNNKIIIIIII